MAFRHPGGNILLLKVFNLVRAIKRAARAALFIGFNVN